MDVVEYFEAPKRKVTCSTTGPANRNLRSPTLCLVPNAPLPTRLTLSIIILVQLFVLWYFAPPQ
jgi:hypothetical protein